MQARRPRSCGEYNHLAPAFLFFAGVSLAILLIIFSYNWYNCYNCYD
ncbi:MAG: hypothetical protein LBP59_09550 [Planctomycetaceae bacterium]|nr:hypothetical protein [Planctomycetaceae bacterium]